ncbi:MAG: hypothetical protein HOE90_20485 [Bacteriovoracaceae bacterium]|jgi:DMSO/TMAO reductase YedYZ heme-binding membrane subunit|nr:hypothetical protein [Bacteriovoracaceae bacterium]
MDASFIAKKSIENLISELEVEGAIAPKSESTRSPRAKKYIEFQKFYNIFLIVFIPSLLYAICRYTIQHNEPWYDLPFYLLNKTLGVSSVIIMSLAYIIGPLAKFSSRYKKYLGHRKYFGIGGFFLGTSHGAMSLLLMSPNNYEVFYNLETGRLNWQGSLSMLFGTLALFHLFFIAIISLPPVMREMHAKQWKNIQKGGIIALLITFLHIAAFGYKSWFNLDKWYGGMPPFSLVGASSILIILFIRKIITLHNQAHGKKTLLNFYQNTHKHLH